MGNGVDVFMARPYREMKKYNPDVWDGVIDLYTQTRATTRDSAAYVIATNVVLFLESGAVEKALHLEVKKLIA